MLGLILGPADRALNKTSSLSPQEALLGHRVSSLTINKESQYFIGNMMFGLLISKRSMTFTNSDFSMAPVWKPHAWSVLLNVVSNPSSVSSTGDDKNVLLSCAHSNLLVASAFEPQNRYTSHSLEQCCEWLVMSALREGELQLSPGSSLLSSLAQQPYLHVEVLLSTLAM